MILEIDIGNTALKWRALEGGQVLDRGAMAAVAEFAALEARLTGVERVRASSVGHADTVAQLNDWARKALGISVAWAQTQAEFAGLVNSYEEPHRLGVDRWLAMLAAYVPRRRAVLVVDVGTAMTLDFVAANGQHCGGYILPGRRLMQESLLKDTSRVRFAEQSEAVLEPGCSTAAGVQNGVLLALVASVEVGVLQARRLWAEDFDLVLTGGDGEKVGAQLVDGGGAYKYIPDLVFEGLGIALP